MKHFLCGSLLLILGACASALAPRPLAHVDVTCVRKFKPEFKADWYAASVDVAGRHVSGLVLFKTMPDRSSRIVFTNEAGLTFFDFEYSGNKFTAYQVMKKLDKKVVVRTLQQDFGIVLMRKFGEETPLAFKEKERLRFVFGKGKESESIITDAQCVELIRLERGPVEKPQTVARLYGKSNQPPDSIFIEHLNFNMTFELRRLVR